MIAGKHKDKSTNIIPKHDLFYIRSGQLSTTSQLKSGFSACSIRSWVAYPRLPPLLYSRQYVRHSAAVRRTSSSRCEVSIPSCLCLTCDQYPERESKAASFFFFDALLLLVVVIASLSISSPFIQKIYRRSGLPFGLRSSGSSLTRLLWSIVRAGKELGRWSLKSE